MTTNMVMTSNIDLLHFFAADIPRRRYSIQNPYLILTHYPQNPMDVSTQIMKIYDQYGDSRKGWLVTFSLQLLCLNLVAMTIQMATAGNADLIFSLQLIRQGPHHLQLVPVVHHVSIWITITWWQQVMWTWSFLYSLSGRAPTTFSWSQSSIM